MDKRLKQLNLKTSLLAVTDMFLPRVCVVCGRDLLLEEKHICFSCRVELPRTHFSSIVHNPMADSLNKKLNTDAYYPFSYATALFYYAGQVGESRDRDYANISKSLKYRRNFASGRYFSGLLAADLKSSELYRDVDMIVPVPLHPLRKWQRGYNQAEIIAREIARSLGCPLETSLLKRSRNTKSQARLNMEQKSRNLHGAFALNPKSKALRASHSHILLVDDVFTTGTTLSQAILSLRACFGEGTGISVATLGYVGHV